MPQEKINQYNRAHNKAVRHYMGWYVPDLEPSTADSSSQLWTMKSPFCSLVYLWTFCGGKRN